MPDVTQRPYARRLKDALRLPPVWVIAAVLLVGRVTSSLAFGGSLGSSVWRAAVIAVPGFLVGIAFVAAFMDPYMEWTERGQPWRMVAIFAFTFVIALMAVGLFARRTL